jgi:guanylate kinase
MILVLSGRAGVGKTTLAKMVIERTDSGKMVVSITTRKPRKTDLLGEYEYISVPAFIRRKTGRHFLWTVEYPKNSGTYYGTETTRLANALSSADVHIMILVPDTVHFLLDYAENEDQVNHIHCFYISASESTLRKRLRERGESSERIEKLLSATSDWDEKVRSCSSTPYRIVENEGSANETLEEILSSLS